LADRDGARREEERSGVVLPAGASAASVYHGVLQATAARFPEDLAAAAVPDDPAAFRSSFPDVVGRFEAARTASLRRAEIARFAAATSRQELLLADGGDERPLAALEVGDGAAIPWKVQPLAGSGRYSPSASYRDTSARGAEIGALARRLEACDLMSADAARALAWVSEEATNDAGEIDLAGRRFALLGAAAELAPLAMLLEAGADVLWVDVQPPPDALAKDSALSGRLFVPETPLDLLARPAEVLATLAAFAEDGPVDVGCFAYAPGRGREWRLTAAMNAVVEALPSASCRSVGLFVSPTSPGHVSADELAWSERRREQRPGWQSALDRLGLTGRGPFEGGDPSRIHRTIVDIQGVSYQAAQHLEKLVSAEAWASRPLEEGGALRVSANVAAITRTRSLRHPIFLAAYAGAEAFGVETFAPEDTRSLNGLLWLHDLLNEEAAPARGQRGDLDLEALLGRRIHGGLYGLPTELRPSLMVAAVLGFARKPSLLGGLIRR
jgi:hypothetical protein